MFITVLSYITKHKALLSVSLGIFLIGIASVYTSSLKKDIEEYKEQIVDLTVSNQLNKAIFDTQISLCKTTLHNQNSYIERFELDKEDYNKVLDEKEKVIITETLKAQEGIKLELSKDSSPDNQLKLIHVILENFSENN